MENIFKDVISNPQNILNLSIIILKGRSFKELHSGEKDIIVRMLESLDYFSESNLPEKSLYKMAESLRFHQLPASFQLIAPKDEFKFFYMLIKGEVEVFSSDTHGGYIKLKTLKSGNCFGHNEIINGFKNRCKYSCLTECVIYVVEQEEFHFIVNNVEIKKSIKFSDLLLNIEPFNKFSVKFLQKIYKFCEKKNYSFNNVIYNENDPVDGLYIIQSGKFQLKRKSEAYKKDSVRELNNNISLLKREATILNEALKGTINTNSDYYQQTISQIDNEKYKEDVEGATFHNRFEVRIV